MKTLFRIATLMIVLAFGSSLVFADPPDAVLDQKAQNYCDYVQQWASNGMGSMDGFDSMGGVCEQMYTDNTLTELQRLRGSGDSTIWTGMYLASQALRYMSTGDAEARDEVLRIARYLHYAKEITDTPGYVARFAALDVAPWNNEYAKGDKVQGLGDWAGYFWVDNTSRDQYTGWWLGLSLAYEAVDDAQMRQTIKDDFKDVIDNLVANNWNIIDQYGIADGNGAAKVLPTMQLSWTLQAASVGADPAYWDLFDELYERYKYYLWFDNFSALNAYGQYFGFNLSHNTWLQLIRLVPDRQRLAHLFNIWEIDVHDWVAHTHNAWYDSVWMAGCIRLGTCDQDEMDIVQADIENTLNIFTDAPNQAVTIVPPTIPLDQFSVWWDALAAQYPFLDAIFRIEPRTAEPHDFADRCWSDMIWQRTPYSISCNYEPDNRVGPGVDYLIAYWTSFYYGLVPSDGPYGDDDLIEPDDDDVDDDDVDDDDSVDDDVDDANDDLDDDTGDDDDDADDDQYGIPDADDSSGDDDDDDGACCG
jgi:hypothetical protein